MTTTLSSVKKILRRELLVPARKIRSRQVLTGDVGLSEFEVNTLLYFIEEKYQVDLNVITPSSTIQELVDSIDQHITTK